MRSYWISAVPHDSHAQYFRAGQRWSDVARAVVVRDVDPALPHGDHELTPEQLDQLRADKRIRIDAAPASDDAAAPASGDAAAHASVAGRGGGRR